MNVAKSDRQIAAQVAVEAVANYPEGYDEKTRRAVLANGEAEGVAGMYLDMIRGSGNTPSCNKCADWHQF